LQGKYLQHNNEKVLYLDELVLDSPLFCVFYCARSFSSLVGRGRREVGALGIAYLELLTLELLTLKLLTLELLSLAPKNAIAFFAANLLTLNTYLS
jgi:hypothetical protein